MSAEESPKIKYERLQRRLQEEILSKYPNPERKGCPGDAVLKALASRPFDESVEGDPNWEHVRIVRNAIGSFSDSGLRSPSEIKLGRRSSGGVSPEL